MLKVDKTYWSNWFDGDRTASLIIAFNNGIEISILELLNDSNRGDLIKSDYIDVNKLSAFKTGENTFNKTQVKGFISYILKSSNINSILLESQTGNRFWSALNPQFKLTIAI